MEDNMNNIQDNPKNDMPILPESEKKTTKNDSRKNKNSFKTIECRVLSYNKKSLDLDVNFNGYGIRIKNVKNFKGDTATLKYKGDIGQPNFDYKLQV